MGNYGGEKEVECGRKRGGMKERRRKEEK